MDEFLAALETAETARASWAAALEQAAGTSLDNGFRAMLDGALAGLEYSVGSVLTNLRDQFSAS